MVTHFSRLQFWAPPDSQAPSPRSSIVEEFKGTYEKDNLVGGGVVIIIIIIENNNTLLNSSQIEN